MTLELHPRVFDRQIDSPISSPNKQIERRLNFDLPEILLTSRPDIKEVAEAMKDIRIIEWVGKRSGDLCIFAAGMHGEETREESSSVASRLEKALNGKVDFSAGSVILIPNLNAPGFIHKTRYVFADERDTNLNMEFNVYQTGEWQEFYDLSNKTQMYAWLLMKYFEMRKDSYRGEHGQDRRVILTDLHAEERAVPQIRIDRMYEEKELLEKLLTSVWTLDIPIVLEYEGWAEIEYDSTITAVANSHDFLSFTIEEGMTYSPDIYARLYIVYQLLKFLEKHGVVALNEESRDRFEKRLLNRPTASIQKAQALCVYQKGVCEILCLDDLLPIIFDSQFKLLSPRQLLEDALSVENWDGIFSFSFEENLRGVRGSRDNIPIAKMAIGSRPPSSLGELHTPIAGYVELADFPDTSWILSLQESPEPKNRIIYYGLFEEDDDNTQEKIIQFGLIDSPEKRQKMLTPALLKEKLQDPNIRIDISILEVTCAVPDSKWEGRTEDGKVILSPKATVVYPDKRLT